MLNIHVLYASFADDIRSVCSICALRLAELAKMAHFAQPRGEVRLRADFAGSWPHTSMEHARSVSRETAVENSRQNSEVSFENALTWHLLTKANDDQASDTSIKRPF